MPIYIVRTTIKLLGLLTNALSECDCTRQTWTPGWRAEPDSRGSEAWGYPDGAVFLPCLPTAKAILNTRLTSDPDISIMLV